MRSWNTLLVGVAIGIAIAGLAGAFLIAQNAQAQHLARFQNVEFDFDTTGSLSTMTFFDRNSGDIYVYIASGTDSFRFARRLTVSELGGPLSASSSSRSRLDQLPERPTGTESDF